MELQETGTCSLCGGPYARYGNNPAPLGHYQQRCCDTCNATRVIPARLMLLADRQKKGT